MRVAIIVYYLTYGGIERQTTKLANEMASRGHSVFLLSFVDNKKCYEISPEVSYAFYPDRGRGLKKKYNRFIVMREALKDIKPDITITFMPQSAYFCAFMGKKIRGTLLYSERGFPGSANYKGLLGYIRKISMKRIDYFVFQIRGARDYFSDDIRRRSFIIHNAVITETVNYSVDTCDKLVVSVGRLDFQKNQKVLIEAFSEIADEYEDYRLEIYGEGELEHDLKELISLNHLDGRVLLKGTSDNIPEVLGKTMVFCLSSEFEGMPNALMEAMAIGVPCVSTDCEPGGAREIIRDGEDGFIVPRGDAHDMAIRIRMLLDNRDLRERFSNEAKKAMKRFDKKTIYDEWDSCIKNCVEE